MNISAKALWIICGIAVVAIVCCVALGKALQSEGKLNERQQSDIQAFETVHKADGEAQLVNDAAKKKADEDAQKKAAIVDGVSSDLDGPDFVRGLQRGLRGEYANSGEDANSGVGTTGKSSGSMPGTNNATGTHANDRP